MSELKAIVWFAALALALSGCGGPSPTLDTTSDATTEASLKAITEGMTDAEKKRFESDCDIATLSAQYETTAPANGSGKKDKLQSLNGLTADEIRSKTSALRAKLSQ
jgi:Family of unknown function (DUF6694)